MRKPLTEQELRAGERKRGMRAQRSKCRVCDADLKPAEQPEGVCDPCLRANSTYVRTA